jgi:RNA polymerase sigma-70 factor (ECF subfamily)
MPHQTIQEQKWTRIRHPGPQAKEHCRRCLSCCRRHGGTTRRSKLSCAETTARSIARPAAFCRTTPKRKTRSRKPICAPTGRWAFNGEARLATWLTRIVINESLERLRKRKQETGKVSLENVVDLEMHIDNAVDGKARPEGPEAAAMRAQTRRLLEHKIDQLPTAFRTVFILRALEEMSVEETAACVGITEATVRTRFFRAKSLLRESLAREIDTVFEDAFAFAGDRCDRIVSAVLERVRRSRADG